MSVPNTTAATLVGSGPDEEDAWNMKIEDDVDEHYIEWKDMNTNQKIWAVCVRLFWVIVILGLLYCFIVSLDLLGAGFQIVSGTTAGRTFRQNTIFDNPLAGLVIGILTTVLVQSSSTSTSIIITMTGSGLLTPEQTVYMIMGTNIGTSVTSTIVAMAQLGDTMQFQRAFAAATVHDMFNFLSVVVLFPVEIATGYLISISEDLVEAMGITVDEDYESPNFLKKATKPLTKSIINVNKKLITKFAEANDEEFEELLKTESMIAWSKGCEQPDEKNAYFLFCGLEDKWSDTAIGFLILVLSLILLVLCLLGLVKALQYNMKGSIVRWLNRSSQKDTSNTHFIVEQLSYYGLVLVGTVATILVQSSSITTSTLTPVVGIGALSLEKMLAITVGANVGTTFTGILAALASSNLNTALTISFTHLFFNISGFFIWFFLPIMRQVPLKAAKWLGKTTVHHRWFALFYLFTVFFVIPTTLLGLSIAGTGWLIGVMTPICLLIIALLVIFKMRETHPHLLHEKFHAFDWLPKWMRTEPAFLKRFHDKVITKAEAKAEKERLEKLEGGAKKPGFAKKVLIKLGDK